MENKKHKVLEALWKHCEKQGEYKFHNDIVKEFSRKYGFGNPFDATKLDNKDKLPESFKKNDIAVIHLGEGWHKFIKGLDKIYHNFEPIPQSQITDWVYKKSILNQFDTSESNVLSVATNQRILHQFLFGVDKEFENVPITNRPKTYFPHRTKTSFLYSIGTQNVELKNMQIEVDLTMEYKGNVYVFEGKNGTPESFSIYQLYHPFLYYYNANQDSTIKGQIKNVYGVYVVREKIENYDVLKIWCYTFENPLDITSIKLVKSGGYRLIGK